MKCIQCRKPILTDSNSNANTNTNELISDVTKLVNEQEYEKLTRDREYYEKQCQELANQIKRFNLFI